MADRLDESISIEEQLQRASSRQSLHRNNPRQTLPNDVDDSIDGYIDRHLPQLTQINKYYIEYLVLPVVTLCGVGRELPR
jgi:hypothetical protein